MQDNLATESSETVETSEQMPTDASNSQLFYETAETETPTEVAQVESDTEVTTEVTQEPESYTVKINGEESTVTLDELRNGYQRQADYTNKTKALAEERKTVEAEKAKAAELDQSIQKLESFLKEPDNDIDMDQLRIDDISEYTRIKEQRELSEKTLSEERSKRDQQIIDQRKAYQEDQMGKLEQAMGDRWTKGTVEENNTAINKDIADARSILSEFEFTDQEQKNLVDNRVWRMLIKFKDQDKQLKEFLAKKEAITKEVEQAPKSIKTGGKTSPMRSDADVFYGSN